MAQLDITTVTARAFDRPTVLVVDDARDNLAVLGHILGPDYRVLLADSGARGLAAARSEPRPSLILLDIVMPDMDGYTVLDRLKKDPATGGIPVIFISALNADDDEQRGLALGAVDYIAKPLRPDIVRARVRTHLELKRARDRLMDQTIFLEAEVSRCADESRRLADPGALRRQLRLLGEDLAALARLIGTPSAGNAPSGESGRLLADSRARLAAIEAAIDARGGTDRGTA